MAEVLVMIEDEAVAERFAAALRRLGHTARRATDAVDAATMLWDGYRPAVYVVTGPIDSPSLVRLAASKYFWTPEAAMLVLTAETLDRPGHLEKLLGNAGVRTPAPTAPEPPAAPN
jgi:hypothetical protein